MTRSLRLTCGLGVTWVALLGGCQAPGPAERATADAGAAAPPALRPMPGSVAARSYVETLRSRLPRRQVAEGLPENAGAPGIPSDWLSSGAGDASALPASVADRFTLTDDGIVPVMSGAVAARAGLHRAEVLLPPTAEGAFSVRDRDSGVSVDVRLGGALPVPVEVTAGYAVYPRGHASGATIVHRPTAEGTEDYLDFGRAPAEEEIAYDLVLGAKVAGLRLASGSGSLELMDAGGAPRLRVRPPSIVDAAGRSHDANITVGHCAVDESPAAPWGRAPTPPGASHCTLRVSWAGLGVTYPALLDPSFVATGSLANGRYNHAQVLLQTGKAMVVGGALGNSNSTTSCELFDAGTGTWSATGSLSKLRTELAAVTLQNGKVLATGGSAGSSSQLQAEIYDPGPGTWSSAGNMILAVQDHTATLLSGGNVLVSGGYNCPGGGPCFVTATSQLYVAGVWSSGPNLTQARFYHAAAALPSGRAVVAGGEIAGSVAQSSAEYYDPGSNSWKAAGALATPRFQLAASALQDGKVLFTGGRDIFTFSANAELYDPIANTMTPQPTMAQGVYLHTQTTLTVFGQVLVVGMYRNKFMTLVGFANLYTEGSGWGPELTPANLRSGAAASLVNIPGVAKVLISGGDLFTYATVELYQGFATATNCLSNADCMSGFCVDTFCCNAACAGGCDQCNVVSKEGTCTVIAQGSPGQNPPCAPYVCDGTLGVCPSGCNTDADCGAGNFCKSFLCIKKYVTGTACTGANQCQSASCSDGFCCNLPCTGACDVCALGLGAGANGTCTNIVGAGSPSCSPYLCNGGGPGCPSTCTADANCAAGYGCVMSACVLKQPQGQPCAANAGCVAGLFCADGVCCNAACTGSCDRCDLGGTVGTCTIAPQGTISQNPSCNTYACDGKMAGCPSSCVVDADCIATAWCSAGKCVAKSGTGVACGVANACLSNFCVDGVCCNGACSGGCDICNANGFLGTCTVLSKGAIGANPSCGNFVCDGMSGSCPIACAVNSACRPGSTCQGGQCLGLNGLSCTSGGQCGTGFCVDGVCCDTTCTAQCAACNTNGNPGTCSPQTGAPAGARSVCATDGTSCGGTCNGVLTAQCTYPVGACRAASCTNGIATAAASCSGNGSCPAPATTSCSPYGCGASACLSSCMADADCIAGDYCVASKCVPKLGSGVTCGGANQCSSGFCVDTVCCGSPCAGQCSSCNAGTPGTCTPVVGVPVGGRGACANGGMGCGGTCDGMNGNACTYPAGSCRAASCAAGVQTAAGSCDGAGSCPAAVTKACAPYVCGAFACLIICNLDSDCIAGDYCNGSNQCVPKIATGNTCTGASQCISGLCVDTVCCSSACAGQCSSCNAGTPGTCLPVKGAPVQGRAACATDGTSCGGSCDGMNGNACAFSVAACRAASCANGVATAAASCNGAGSCPAASTTTCTPYVCGASACLTSCTKDTDCIGGDYCGANKCTPKLALGASCTVGGQCGSTFCVDTVCCSGACAGQCSTCNGGTPGTCTAVAGAPVGGRAACISDGSVCGGSCDSMNGNACAYPTNATTCRAASCANGTQTAAASCAGAGSCPAIVTTPCGAYVCGANACLTSCANDSNCIAGDYCNANQCRPKLGNGVACGAASWCVSSFCTDGVCCNSACGGQCASCATMGNPGTCAPVNGPPVGGRAACASDGGGICGGTCNGINSAACAYPAVACRAASCANGIATAPASCDGAGSCPGLVNASCNPYICGGNKCLASCTKDTECQMMPVCTLTTTRCDKSGCVQVCLQYGSDFYCSANQCVPSLALGAACTASNQCGSRACVDGVCCDGACTGQCSSCSAMGNVGFCTAVNGAPTGGRAACASDGTVCGGSCDGANRAACAYPANGVTCRPASCANGVQTSPASCNAGGACPALMTTSCGLYVCGAFACLSICAVDGDCAAGNYCNAMSQCVPKLGLGKACTAPNQCALGQCADGVCCNSACTGQCASCNAMGSAGSCIAIKGAPVFGRAACASDGTLCGGSCDGMNPAACAYPTNGISCRAASCAAGVQTNPASCDSKGACPAVMTQVCGSFLCGMSACKTNCGGDADCAAGNYCNMMSVCVPQLPLGAACSAANQCALGQCVDGVCCDSACNGQCSYCAGKGNPGHCTAALGVPLGGRAACKSDGSACGGMCDGMNGAACAYRGGNTFCRLASCQNGVATLGAGCDGMGGCPAPMTVMCAPYVCGAFACLTSCSKDGDCLANDYCNAMLACAPKLMPGQTCTGLNQCASGFCADGVCCQSACTDQCATCSGATPGTCTAAKGVPVGGRPACAGDGTTCNGTCDGTMTQSCSFPLIGTMCAPGTCLSGVATAASSCDKNGACVTGTTMMCPAGCDGIACAALPDMSSAGDMVVASDSGAAIDQGNAGSTDDASNGKPPAGGCSCNVATRSGGGGTGAFFAVLLVGAMVVRRKRRSSNPADL